MIIIATDFHSGYLFFSQIDLTFELFWQAKEIHMTKMKYTQLNSDESGTSVNHPEA